MVRLPIFLFTCLLSLMSFTDVKAQDTQNDTIGSKQNMVVEDSCTLLTGG